VSEVSWNCQGILHCLASAHPVTVMCALTLVCVLKFVCTYFWVCCVRGRWTTKIRLPLKSDMKQLAATRMLAARFHDIQPSLLLFLHRLRSITIYNQVLRAAVTLSVDCQLVLIYCAHRSCDYCHLTPLTSTWPKMTSGVGLEEGEY